MRYLKLILGFVTGVLVLFALYAFYQFVFEGRLAQWRAEIRPDVEEEVGSAGAPSQAEESLDAPEVDVVVEEDVIVETALEPEVSNAEIDAELLDEASQILENRASSWSFEGELYDFEEEVNFERHLPDGLELVIAETKDYRLDRIDVEDLFPEIEIAIWPDSPLALSQSGYFLINPPTDIMELYYVQAATADLSDFYFDSMKNAQGMFVRRGDELLTTGPLGELFFAQMKLQNKAVIAYAQDLPEAFYEMVVKEGVRFARIDYVLEGEDLGQEWQEIVREHQSQGDAPYFVLLEAQGQNIEEFKRILRETDYEIGAVIVEPAAEE